MVLCVIRSYQLSIYTVYKIKNLLNVGQNDINLLHYILFAVAMSVDRRKQLAIPETVLV